MVTRIQQGGTGQTTAAGARIALGLSDAEIIAIVGTPAGAQPLDADLTAIAALTTTGYGRGLLELANAAAGRTYLSLGTMAVETATNYLTVSAASSTYYPLAGTSPLKITGAAATARYLEYQTAGSTRWQVATDNSAESGTNAGSGFAIYRYSDAGSYLGQPVYIQRSDGKVFFETAPSFGGANILNASGQIPFPATANLSSDANTLDDYEEGTWTPVYVPGTSGAFGTTTYETDTIGFYTKIGRIVYVHFSIATTAFAVGTAVGGPQISGLPFVSLNGYPYVGWSRSGVGWVGYRASFASGAQAPDGITVLPNTNKLSLQTQNSGTSNGAGFLLASMSTTAGTQNVLIGGAMYLTAS
jgi:hypothetical protein